jgi:hypothetical protein
MAHAFRDLTVWQRSMKLTIAIYGLSKELPTDERFGLTSQIRRSAVSIPSNVAEGQGRLNVGEFKQFLGECRMLVSRSRKDDLCPDRVALKLKTDN